MKKNYQFSAPGSIMIMGEHAVLRDKLALVGAVNKRMTVTLTPQNNDHIDIYSELGEYHSSFRQIDNSIVFSFVIAAIKSYQKKIVSGFRLEIDSEFSSTVGLGSSSAVVVATLACLQQWLIKKTDQQKLFFDARAIIQEVQGRGSGADVAASVFGGIIKYGMNPVVIHKSHNVFDMALIYTGYKTPTPEVIKIVDERVMTHPEKYTQLFDTMHSYSEQAWFYIEKQDWISLGKLMNQHQNIQNQLGVCDKITFSVIDQLHRHPDVLGCKISGSGLGDCVVALVSPQFQWKNDGFMQIDVSLSTVGLRFDSGLRCDAQYK